MLIVQLFIGYFAVLGLLYGIDTVREANQNKETAYIVAQGFISQKLIRPASARFPSIDDDGVRITSLGKNHYSISGYLLSKNTFGSELRSEYSCTIRYVGSGEWVYEKILFE